MSAYFNKLKTVKSEIIAIASANRKASIIVISILGDAPGLRESPLTDSLPTRAITIDGPKVLMSIINISIKFFIFSYLFCVP